MSAHLSVWNYSIIYSYLKALSAEILADLRTGKKPVTNPITNDSTIIKSANLLTQTQALNQFLVALFALLH